MFWMFFRCSLNFNWMELSKGSQIWLNSFFWKRKLNREFGCSNSDLKRNRTESFVANKSKNVKRMARNLWRNWECSQCFFSVSSNFIPLPVSSKYSFPFNLTIIYKPFTQQIFDSWKYQNLPSFFHKFLPRFPH